MGTGLRLVDTDAMSVVGRADFAPELFKESFGAWSFSFPQADVVLVKNVLSQHLPRGL